MASKDEQLETLQPRTPIHFNPPNYTLAFLMMVFAISIGTAITILSSTYSKSQADGYKIMDQNQVYRAISSPFAVASFLDLFFMGLAFFWLLFTLTEYERKYSTVYTVFHFWKVNINIVMGVSWMYYIMYLLTGMKNFIMNVGGIFPYALHMYLKTCLEKPSAPINHWFLPCPVNRWVMGFLVCIILILTVPETQGCMVVFFYYLFCSFMVLIRHITSVRCFYFEGPACYWPIRCIERLIPACIKERPSFCSIAESQKQQQELDLEENKRQQLEEEIQPQN